MYAFLNYTAKNSTSCYSIVGFTMVGSYNTIIKAEQCCWMNNVVYCFNINGVQYWILMKQQVTTSVVHVVGTGECNIDRTITVACSLLLSVLMVEQRSGCSTT